jgi:hypothetical protein
MHGWMRHHAVRSAMLVKIVANDVFLPQVDLVFHGFASELEPKPL